MRRSRRGVQTGLFNGVICKKKAEPYHARYNVPAGLADPLTLTSTVGWCSLGVVQYIGCRITYVPFIIVWKRVLLRQVGDYRIGFCHLFAGVFFSKCRMGLNSWWTLIQWSINCRKTWLVEIFGVKSVSESGRSSICQISCQTKLLCKWNVPTTHSTISTFYQYHCKVEIYIEIMCIIFKSVC